MNKWQVICPLGALLVVTLVYSLASGSRHRRDYVNAQSRMISEELIGTTNSPRVNHIGRDLHKRLKELLSAPACVADIVPGDEPAPIGDGSACTRLMLSNLTGLRLGIRLRQDSNPERFHIIGFWTVAEPRSETNSKPQTIYQ
jgi:hypothetical protein